MSKGSTSKEEALVFLEANHQNRRKLDGCFRHAFVGLIPENKIQEYYRCRSCNGTVSYETKTWYELGLKHASHQ